MNCLGIRTIGDGNIAFVNSRLTGVDISNRQGLRTIGIYISERSRSNRETRVRASNGQRRDITPVDERSLGHLAGVNHRCAKIKGSRFRILHILKFCNLDIGIGVREVTGVVETDIPRSLGELDISGRTGIHICCIVVCPYGAPGVTICTLFDVKHVGVAYTFSLIAIAADT